MVDFKNGFLIGAGLVFGAGCMIIIMITAAYLLTAFWQDALANFCATP